jgi:hypothetical protein
VIQRSSVVERSAVNRLVVGSNPTAGAILKSAKSLFAERISVCFRHLCRHNNDAGWSSLVARQAHNLKVAGSNPAPATNFSAPIAIGSPILFAFADSRDFVE